MSTALGDRLARGAAWTLGANLGRRGIGLLARIAFARLLSPEDFGLVALALFVINIGAQFQDLGLGAALVYFRDRVPERAGTCFWTTALLGAGLALICTIVAGPVALAFGEPRAASLMMVLAGMLFLNALAVTPLSLLRRELRNGAVAVIEVAGTFLGLATGIVMAWQGAGAWSLVAGTLVQSFSSSVLAWLALPLKLAWRWDGALAREMFQYGYYVIGSGLATLLVLTVDNALVQAWFGAETLGYYVMAYSLAGLVASEIGGVVSTLLFPALSGLREDRERLRLGFMRAAGVGAAVALPLCAATAILGPAFVKGVLGQRWAPAIPLLQVLCVFGVLRACFGNTGTLFQACGRPQVKFWLDLSQTGVLVLAAFGLRSMGAMGVAWAVVVSALVTLSISLVSVESLLGRGAVRGLAACLAGPALASALSGGIVLILLDVYRRRPESTDIIAMLWGVPLGGLIYLGALRWTDRGAMAELERVRSAVMARAGGVPAGPESGAQ